MRILSSGYVSDTDTSTTCRVINSTEDVFPAEQPPFPINVKWKTDDGFCRKPSGNSRTQKIISIYHAHVKLVWQLRVMKEVRAYEYGTYERARKRTCTGPRFNSFSNVWLKATVITRGGTTSEVAVAEIIAAIRDGFAAFDASVFAAEVPPREIIFLLLKFTSPIKGDGEGAPSPESFSLS